MTVKCVKHFIVKSRIPVGKPKNTCHELERKNLESKGLERQIAYNHAKIVK